MDSVSVWIERMEGGDDEAARALWERFFKRLIGVARRRLRGMPERVVDPEDVAASVFESVFMGMQEGRFDRLRDRDDLWRLLAKLTRWKAVDAIRRENAEVRGGGEVLGASVLGENADLDVTAGADPTPEDVAMLAERLAACLESLTDPTVRRVAEMRLAGWRNCEIGEELDIPVSSVELKLKIIRRRWAALAEPTSTGPGD